MSNFTFDDDSVIVNDFEALLKLQDFYKLIISSEIINEMADIEKIRQTKMASSIKMLGEDYLEHDSYEFLIEKLKFEDFDIDKFALTFPNKNIEFYSKNKLINSFNLQNI